MKFDFEWDDEVIRHIERHGISRSDIDEMFLNRFYWRLHAGGLFIVGRSSDRIITLFLSKGLTKEGKWRVATARRANEWEKRLLWRRGKGFR